MLVLCRYTIDLGGRVSRLDTHDGSKRGQLKSSTDKRCPFQPCAMLDGVYAAGTAEFIALQGQSLTINQYHGQSLAKAKSTRQPLAGFSWQSIDLATITASSFWTDETGKNSYAPDNLKKPNSNPWHSGKASKSQPGWLSFSFPQDITVDGFRVKAHSGWDGSAFKDFRFEISSDDGATWKTAKLGQGSNLDCCVRHL